MNTENVYATQRNYEVADKIVKQCEGLTTKQMEVVMKRLHKATDQKELDEIIADPINLMEFDKGDGKMSFDGVATGFELLDQNYLLGLKPGDVVVVGAYTGLGKSTFTMSWCMDMAAAGQNVLLFAFEDGDYEISSRKNMLMRGKGITKADYEKWPGKLMLYPMDSRHRFFKNKFDVIPVIEAFVLTRNLNVVCLDMLNDIIDPINDRDAEDFMVALKEMCDKLGIILITTSRLREPKGITAKAQWYEQYMPTEDSIYGKGLIKYLATKIITLAPSSTREATTTGTGYLEVSTKYVAVSVCKNRVGKTTKEEGIVVTYALSRGQNYIQIKEMGVEGVTYDGR